MQRRRFISSIVAIPASMLIIGCQKKEENTPKAKVSTSMATSNHPSKMVPHDAKVLKIGMDTDFAPFEFNDPETQKLIGFDVDLAEAIARQLNKIPEIVTLPFVNLIPALDSGEIDMVVSCMAVTEDRKNVVSFSRPYYKSSLALLTNEENNSIKTVDDLRGKKVGARQGSTSAAKVSQITAAKVVLFDSVTEMFQALQDNKIDAMINDLPVIAFRVIQGGKGKLIGDSFNIEDYAIAVKKGDLKLLGEVNKALDLLEKNGTYNQIMEKWFGK